MKNLYMLICVVLPEFNGIFAADVDFNPAAGMIGFGIVRELLRIITDSNKPISQKLLVVPGN